MIRGSVDVVTTKNASGWIYTDAQKDPLAVEAVLNHQVLARATADLHRPDLTAAGFGDGRCGFELAFASEIDPLYLPFVRVHLAGTDLTLRRWIGAGFADYFRALYERYPRTGRAASVYGGLWIDRTDAAGLLKGRCDIGAVSARDANSIARLIQDGVLLMTRREEQKQAVSRSASSDLPTAVAEAVFDEDLLRLLRSIFDDNPIAIRADVLESDQKEFIQTSALEDLPSPAECLAVISPSGSQGTTVDVIRGGHRLPEFLPSGLSRWIREGSASASQQSTTPDMAVDRYTVPRGSVRGARSEYC
jgi:hypothetical protein